MTKITALCSADSCGRPAVTKAGFCLRDYKRWKRRGTTHTITVEERFFGNVQQDSECWIWTGHIQIGGYGRVWIDQKQRLAHRWSYEFLRAEIPQGLQLDHLCRRPACVNPWHLEPVTGHVNLLRGDTVTGLNARKTHCKWGHPFTPENTYTKPGNGSRGCRICRRAADQRCRSKKKQ
jgi:hypothetical protein